MSGPERPIARIDDLTLRYGRTFALDAVTLNIPSGCMAGLIGPDGVGKSSLLAVIGGARRIQTGQVHVLGGDMADARHRNEVCSRIAYMPQGLGKNLYPDLTVRENIEFFGRLFGQARHERERRIAELLYSTGLAPFPDRPAKKLSGGMRQKLGLCCALIHDPDLLILDEPTTGVDPLSRRQFWDLIERIRGRHPGMSVIVATGYMEEAERLDWLVAMNAGKILAAGSPSDLKAKTGTDSVEAAFVELLPEGMRDGRREFIVPPRRRDDHEPVITAQDLTCRFGDFTAVDRASFTIERGEIFGFLGPNGCGKTTTMKMLTGLLPATAGQAFLLGAPINAADLMARELRVAGYGGNGVVLSALRAAAPDSVEVQADLNGDGDTTDANEIVGYRYDPTKQALMRSTGGGSPQPLVDHVPAGAFTLRYRDGAGVSLTGTLDAASRAQVREVEIQLGVEFPADPGQHRTVLVTHSERVELRNAGL